MQDVVISGVHPLIYIESRRQSIDKLPWSTFPPHCHTEPLYRPGQKKSPYLASIASIVQMAWYNKTMQQPFPSLGAPSHGFVPKPNILVEICCAP